MQYQEEINISASTLHQECLEVEFFADNFEKWGETITSESKKFSKRLKKWKKERKTESKWESQRVRKTSYWIEITTYIFIQS